jgi:heme exporter protein A
LEEDGGAVLALRGVACRRGGRILFRGVDLLLAPGKAALVTGPNGVGKSSLLRLIAGLLPAVAGTLHRGGAMALADEQVALDRERTLGEALAFWAALDAVESARLATALADLDLDHLADIPVRMLSTGQRKRAGLARAIASGAPIWLLDEPVNGLDAASRERLALAVARHRQAGGVVVATSHLDLPWTHDVMLALSAPHEKDASWEDDA